MHDQRSSESLKMPGWAVGIIVTLLLTIGGGLVAWGAVESEVERLKDAAKDATAAKELVIKHEALIPILQKDVQEIKDTQKGMAQDLKEIARALKA